VPTAIERHHSGASSIKPLLDWVAFSFTLIESKFGKLLKKTDEAS
jgi:hypothetical protein